MTEKFWGKYRAEVLDNNDPKKRGRVKVKCERLMPGRPELGWAESCFMPGHFFIPRKGDYVWIEFEEGDIHLPVWVGIMPTRKYVKEYLFEGFGDRVNYDHLISMIRTPIHHLQFKNDDLKGNKQVIIKDKSGSSIVLDADVGDINVKATDHLNNIAGGNVTITEAKAPTHSDPPSPKSIIPLEVDTHG